MNFAEIEKTWQSPHNRPSADELEREKMKFTADLHRRHRDFLIFLSLVFTALTLVTGTFVFQLLRTGSAAGGVDVSREWGALLIMALPWFAAVLFARQYRRHRLRHSDPEQSISAGVRALLDENRLSRVRLKWIAILHGALIIVLPIVVYQLRAVGKAGDEILVPAFVIWPVIAIGILLALRFHDRRTLLPRKQQLETLLNSYEL